MITSATVTTTLFAAADVEVGHGSSANCLPRTGKEVPGAFCRRIDRMPSFKPRDVASRARQLRHPQDARRPKPGWKNIRAFKLHFTPTSAFVAVKPRRTVPSPRSYVKGPYPREGSIVCLRQFIPASMTWETTILTGLPLREAQRKAKALQPDQNPKTFPRSGTKRALELI